MNFLENLENNIGSKLYEVILMSQARNELEQTKYYITNVLYARNAADKLINLIENELSRLEYLPELYPEIEKLDELKRKYRRIVIKKYVVLYAIDFENQKVFVSHIIYRGRNYINNNHL